MKLTIMMPIAFLASTSLTLVRAQGASQVFSQYLGAATVTAMPFAGLSSIQQSADFDACTDFVHALPPLDPTVIGTSALPQLEQQFADEVCQFCTSVSLSRPDSCCAVATSVACFQAFASGGGGVSSSKTTSPASSPASTTATAAAANTATGTTSASTPAATSAKSGAYRLDAVSLHEDPLIVYGGTPANTCSNAGRYC